MVFQAISPASVPTSRSGPLPNIGTCSALRTSASKEAKVSVIASLGTGSLTVASAPEPRLLTMAVQAESLPNSMRSRSPLPVSKA